MTETQLRLSEAVPLGTVMIQELCRNHRIRALFLKGPAATILGVRPAVPSSDIDVLVLKSDMEATVALLQANGWAIRGEGWDEYYSSHSITMFHTMWPCDIDIHYRFPGIANTASEAFEVLYAERQPVILAGHAVEVPGPLGAVCIQALHALRNPWIRAQQESFKFLLEEVPAPDKESLLAFARELQALAAMKPYFTSAYPMPADYPWPRPSLEWIARTTARTRGSIRLMELIDAPWRDKFRIFARQLVPTAGTTIDTGVGPLEKQTPTERIRVNLASAASSVRETVEYLKKRNGQAS